MGRVAQCSRRATETLRSGWAVRVLSRVTRAARLTVGPYQARVTPRPSSSAPDRWHPRRDPNFLRVKPKEIAVAEMCRHVGTQMRADLTIDNRHTPAARFVVVAFTDWFGGRSKQLGKFVGLQLHVAQYLAHQTRINRLTSMARHDLTRPSRCLRKW